MNLFRKNFTFSKLYPRTLRFVNIEMSTQPNKFDGVGDQKDPGAQLLCPPLSALHPSMVEWYRSEAVLL